MATRQRSEREVRRSGRRASARGGGPERGRKAFASRLVGVIGEVARTLEGVVPDQEDVLAKAIVKARRVYATGAGRSGLVSSCFAMRLVHLGLVAHVVGEATAPGLGGKDLLVVSSGSGRTRTGLAQAEAARSRGARVAVVTADVDSPLAKEADIVVGVPCPPFARSAKTRTQQPGGTLFEQSLLIFFDGLILDLAERLDWSPTMLKFRHANLE